MTYCRIVEQSLPSGTSGVTPHRPGPQDGVANDHRTPPRLHHLGSGPSTARLRRRVQRTDPAARFHVILPVAWRHRDLLHGHKYPVWLLVVGILAWLLTLYLGYESLKGLSKL